ncbi:MAG: MarR family transcriptional regulator [Alphaproteobacteria bacterium]|jgi:DNA-binding MarR family transcriptional regulator|uniref:MarR family transcriptional regulator n=1 Tax=Maricaulis alexandrii TaxID=2570354 RepID=UPI0011090747|nr:MarR family transcriptional regulator [Maricaulis alexandrii]MCR9266657.1 MarR family transcriptional regulator [Alphaproteobacteria bacterium]
MASQAMTSLEMMRRVSADSVRGATADLTARQFALLLAIFMRPGPHAVRDLSKQLDLPKPAVTRALDVLERQGFVRRKKDQADKRDVSVHRTVKGAVFLYDYGERVALRAEETRTCPNWIPVSHPPVPISQPRI